MPSRVTKASGKVARRIDLSMVSLRKSKIPKAGENTNALEMRPFVRVKIPSFSVAVT